jgi:hypothetical protein
MSLRVGIIGASGIGFIHALHYNNLGANVVAVLCSSESSAKKSSKKLTKIFDTNVASHHNLDDFLDEELNAVSICSPPFMHVKHIQACFDRKIPVFCEKPLFWSNAISLDDVNLQLNAIKSHVNRRIFVNTSNTIFIDTIEQNERQLLTCKNFSFEFYTNGNNKGMSIGEDLLPHGISLLLNKIGNFEISNFTSRVSKHSFKCSFIYGGCEVKFDFRENPNGPKHMNIGINDNSYTRIQVGTGSSYKVSLINDFSKKNYVTEDPFQIYISRFLDYVRNFESKDKDQFNDAEINLRLMAQCLHLTKNN